MALKLKIGGVTELNIVHQPHVDAATLAPECRGPVLSERGYVVVGEGFAGEVCNLQGYPSLEVARF